MLVRLINSSFQTFHPLHIGILVPYKFAQLSSILNQHNINHEIKDFQVILREISNKENVNKFMSESYSLGDKILNLNLYRKYNEKITVEYKDIFNKLIDVTYSPDINIYGFSLSHCMTYEVILTLSLIEKIKRINSNSTVVIAGTRLFCKDPLISILEEKIDYNLINIAYSAEEFINICLLETKKQKITIPDEMKGKYFEELKEYYPSINKKIIDPDYSKMDIKSYGFSLKKYFAYYEIEEKNYPEQINIIPYQFVAGCPRKCAFCHAATAPIVYKTPKEVAYEIRGIVDNYDCNYFFFLNPEININKNYLVEVCDEIIRQKIEILWSDSLFLNNLENDLFYKLRDAGCIRLSYGVETASNKMLKYINKPLNIRKVQKYIKEADKAGIWNFLNIIIGLPYETENDVIETERLIDQCKNSIECYQIVEFILQKLSPFGFYPAKYKLELLANYGEYNESDGLKWNEIKLRNQKTFKRIWSLIDFNMMMANQNLHLIYYLYNKYRDKQIVKDWIRNNILSKSKHHKI